MTNLSLDPDAALAEGLAPMPADVVQLRNEKVSLDEQIDLLTSRRDEIKGIIGRRLEEDGLTGFILDGKVKARASSGQRTGVDSRRLRAELPHVWERFIKVTQYKSINIS